MHEAGAGQDDAGGAVLAVLELLELGGRLGLLEVLGLDVSRGDLLDELDDGVGRLRDVGGVAGDGGVQQPGVRVDGARGADLGVGRGFGIAEERKAG